MDEIDDILNKNYENKVEEYFQIKQILKTLRDDLKEFKQNHENFEELEEISKKVKEIREKIKIDENIRIVTEKIEVLKERMELVKEIIKADLIQNEQEEIKLEGRKLKIIPVLKEMKDEESS